MNCGTEQQPLRLYSRLPGYEAEARTPATRNHIHTDTLEPHASRNQSSPGMPVSDLFCSIYPMPAVLNMISLIFPQATGLPKVSGLCRRQAATARRQSGPPPLPKEKSKFHRLPSETKFKVSQHTDGLMMVAAAAAAVGGGTKASREEQEGGEKKQKGLTRMLAGWLLASSGEILPGRKRSGLKYTRTCLQVRRVVLAFSIV